MQAGSSGAALGRGEGGTGGEQRHCDGQEGRAQTQVDSSDAADSMGGQALTPVVSSWTVASWGGWA